MSIRSIGIASAVALGALGIGVATAMAAGPPGQARHPHSWHTCVPQATLHVGIYEFDNDLFTGRRGPSCITVTDGRELTIDRNYRAQQGGVVAYPAERLGTYAYNRDPRSGLPALVGKVKLSVRVGNTGHAGGFWIDDLDIWLSRPNTPLRHIREIIIVDRWSGYSPYCDPYSARISHRHWSVGMCWTSSHGRSWPLIRFIAHRPTRHLVATMDDFLDVAMRHHWIGNRMVVSSVSEGTECWSGCRGLTDRLIVRKYRGRRA